MSCRTYPTMTYVRNLVICVCIQFLLIWTFWNEGIDSSNETSKLNTAIKGNQANVNDAKGPVQLENEKFKEPGCARKDNVVFVKPHYSGGSTIENILNRIGLKSDKIVLSHVSCVPSLSEDSNQCELQELPIFSHKEYLENVEMTMGHILHKPKEIRRIFPADTSIITFLRHPFEQIQFDLHKHGFKGSTEKSNVLEKSPNNSQYSQLFNIPPSIHTNISEIHKYLDAVNANFSLVGIAEYFEESLILLKRKHCWSLEDILHVNSQVLPYSSKIQPDMNIVQTHRQTNQVEYVVYEYFKEHLFKTFAKQDSSFNDEFFHFIKINKLANKFCSKVYSSLHRTLDLEDEEFLSVPSSRWNKAFNVTTSMCAAMKVNNRIYQDIFLMKRYPHLCNNSKLFTHKQNLSGLCKVTRNTISIPKELLFDPDAYLIERKKKM